MCSDNFTRRIGHITDIQCANCLGGRIFYSHHNKGGRFTIDDDLIMIEQHRLWCPGCQYIVREWITEREPKWIEE